MSKIILAYAVTHSLLGDFKRTLAARKKVMPYVVDGNLQHEVVFTDRLNDLPIRQIVDPSFGDGRSHNLSKMRNAAFACANETNADWLITLDADSLFLGVTEFPKTGFGFVNIFFQNENEPLNLLPPDGPWTTASWWIFSKAIFKNPAFRHDEEYFGQHVQDLDFMENVLFPAGIIASPTDARAIHLWHPSRAIPEDHARNMERYHAKRAQAAL